MIKYNEKTGVFSLNTKNSTYQIRIVKLGLVTTLYYGKKIEDEATYLTMYSPLSFSPIPPDGEEDGIAIESLNEECPTYGVGDFREHMLEIADKDGISVTDVRYKSHKIYKGKKPLPGLPHAYDENGEADVLEILTEDAYTGAQATLIYSVFEECDAIVKSVKVKNPSENTLTIKRCLSSCIGFELPDFDVLVLKGEYSVERMLKRFPLHSGKQTIDSLRGASSHALNPFMGLVSHDATETYGDAFGTAFIYSGNFTCTAERAFHEKTRLVMGINPQAFSWELKSGEEFVAPEVVHVYSDKGIGGMSRCFHDFCNSHITNGEWKTKKRPLLINNWEGTYFNFTGEKIIDIARSAAELGINMLVLDDGWFGKRDNDYSGLGDWVANEQKLGMSLKQLAKSINDLGLKFGLWFEPEMISADSDLYRAHPDYAMHVEGRPISLSRHQMVLNFAKPEVVDNIYNQMAKILNEVNVEYIKWDFNRNICEVCDLTLGKDRQGEVFHRYMLGLYSLLERLRKAFPHILFESCSGGGGRCDFGILYYMQQNWASDTTDATNRLKIQHGTSVVYPVRTIGSHYSVTPNHGSGRTQSVRTRAEVARFGSNGYELDLTQVSPEDKKELIEINKEFHKYYDLVNFGDLYRLVSIFEEADSAWMFLAKDKSEALVEYATTLMHCTHSFPLLKLKGIDETRYYREEYSGEVYHGSVLANVGIRVTGIHRDFIVNTYHFVAVD